MVALWLVGFVALALDTPPPFPVVTEVVGLDEVSPCTDVPETHVPRTLRSSAGVLTHRGDGSYAWVCPSVWEGELAPKVATTPDGELMMAITDTQVFLSKTAGCSSEELSLPEGLLPVDVTLWRNQLFVLAAVEGEDLGGGLFYWDGAAFGELHRWTDGFEPHAMLPGDAGVLWVTSIQRYNSEDDEIRPGARVRRLTVQGGLDGAGTDLEPLPEDILDITDLRPRAADRDEAWFVVARGTQAWTWHAQIVEGSASTVPLFTDTFADAAKPRFVQGPAKFDNTWVAVFDGVIHTSSQLSRQWAKSKVQVPWTCLQTVGDRVFACTPRALLAVTDFDSEAVPTTSEVFAPVQLAEPADGCGEATCAADFAEVLDAGEVTQLDPASCPDGRTLADLEGGEACACAQTSPGGWGMALAGLLAAGRRRYSAPPASTKMRPVA